MCRLQIFIKQKISNQLNVPRNVTLDHQSFLKKRNASPDVWYKPWEIAKIKIYSMIDSAFQCIILTVIWFFYGSYKVKT